MLAEFCTNEPLPGFSKVNCLFLCLSVVERPGQEYFAHVKTLSLTVFFLFLTLTLDRYRYRVGGQFHPGRPIVDSPEAHAIFAAAERNRTADGFLTKVELDDIFQTFDHNSK